MVSEINARIYNDIELKNQVLDFHKGSLIRRLNTLISRDLTSGPRIYKATPLTFKINPTT